jgi:hypothetical protein
MSPTPFIRQTKPEYAVEAAKEMRATLLPTRDAPIELVVEGPCPECEEEMSYRHPLFIVKDAQGVSQELAAWLWNEALRRSGSAEKALEEFTIYCQCETVHEKDQKGCGAYWKLKGNW